MKMRHKGTVQSLTLVSIISRCFGRTVIRWNRLNRVEPWHRRIRYTWPCESDWSDGRSPWCYRSTLRSRSREVNGNGSERSSRRASPAWTTLRAWWREFRILARPDVRILYVVLRMRHGIGGVARRSGSSSVARQNVRYSLPYGGTTPWTTSRANLAHVGQYTLFLFW
jgi:hypothetical protein